jgi:alkylation response protein AidB-like acyl-CoA dehydrogenase
VDFELDSEQSAIEQAVGELLAQHAGPARAIELATQHAYDHELETALEAAGFADLGTGHDTGPLEAALLVEAVARAAGTIAIGAGALVAPRVVGQRLPGPVALARSAAPEPVRFGAHARHLLVCDGDEARHVTLEPGDVEPVASSFGFPMGRVRASVLSGGASLGPGSGTRLRDWWRVSLAAECVGAMHAALQVTVDYLKQRRQFGRPIGSFQAVQHRLAECAVQLEGSRWLACEAAHHEAPAHLSCAAAAYATHAARQVFSETHQLTGAIGFTREHDLHVWSMRLQALRLELDGAAGHRRALARARWARSA